MKHYLLSVMVGGGHVHAYMMTRDKNDLTRATNELCNVAKRIPGYFPVIMSTSLTGGEDMVRATLHRHFPEVREKMKTSKNFHLTIWHFPDDEPDNAKLLELH
jgi:hypothetical protein